MKQHNAYFSAFLDYFDQYCDNNEAQEVFFFLGPLGTIHQLFPEQKTKCVSVLVCKLQAYNKAQVQKLHLSLAEPIIRMCRHSWVNKILTNYRTVSKENNLICGSKISCAFLYAELKILIGF